MRYHSLKHIRGNVPMADEPLPHKYNPSDFGLPDRLFRGFRKNDLDNESGEILANSIRFPDFSCNWERFSAPEDVKRRNNGLETDGCYAFTVEVSRYKDMATPCHDPNPENDPGNYAHVEVRQVRPGESVFEAPPHGRPKFGSKSMRMEYRQHIVYNLECLIEPTA
ncbi:hypothetical protein R80B4_02045 [Fibrobacteres bacterium R8-0-B4]